MAVSSVKKFFAKSKNFPFHVGFIVKFKICFFRNLLIVSKKVIKIEHKNCLVRYHFEPYEGPKELLCSLTMFSGYPARYNDRILIETPLSYYLPLEHNFLLEIPDGFIFKIKHRNYENRTEYILIPTNANVSFVVPIFDVNFVFQ